MAAFQSGFQLGSRIATDALDRKERAERQKKEDEERALRMDLTRLQLTSATEDAQRRADVARITRGLTDTIQGVDRPATAAALDADFNAALQASDNAVMAENAARQGVPAPAAPAATGPAAGVMPVAQAAPAVPAVRGGSNAANEAALTVRNTVDPLSPEYRQRVGAQLSQLAAATGDIERLRSLETERRTAAEDSLIAQSTKEFKGTDDQIGATTMFVNNTSKRITMSDPDKNGLVGLSVVKPDGRASFETLSRAEQAKVYAAVRLLEVNPTRAMKMIEDVNKDLAQAIRDENLVTSQVVGATNTVAKTSADINNINADNKRADDEVRHKGAEKAAARAEAQTKANAAVALYKQNNPKATQAEVDAVRAGVLSATPNSVSKDAPAVVQLAQWALQAKIPGITNMADALQWANQSREKSQKEFEQDIYGKALAASMGDTKSAERAVTEARKFFVPAVAPGPQAGPAPGAAPAQGKGAPLVFATEADAEAAGAAGKIPPGAKFTVLRDRTGRQVDGVQWLPAQARPTPVPRPPAAAGLTRNPQAVADEFATIGAVPR